MTQLIVPYLSQFYPLIIGLIIFALLKSLNLLKHKTRIDLDTPVAKDDIELSGSISLSETADIKDLSEEPDKGYSFYRYVYFGMNRFSNYLTYSAEPRKAALSRIVTDRLITEGISSRRLSESDTLNIASRRFGMVDLHRYDALPERIKVHKKLELAFPDNASFLNAVLGREELSATLLMLTAGYNIGVV